MKIKAKRMQNILISNHEKHNILLLNKKNRETCKNWENQRKTGGKNRMNHREKWDIMSIVK